MVRWWGVPFLPPVPVALHLEPHAPGSLGGRLHPAGTGRGGKCWKEHVALCRVDQCPYTRVPRRQPILSPLPSSTSSPCLVGRAGQWSSGWARWFRAVGTRQLTLPAPPNGLISARSLPSPSSHTYFKTVPDHICLGERLISNVTPTEKFTSKICSSGAKRRTINDWEEGKIYFQTRQNPPPVLPQAKPHCRCCLVPADMRERKCQHGLWRLMPE